jgi:predicted NBD/HSP70 family sugar kinase
MRVLHAPQLRWRNVDLREPLSAAVGLPVQIENSGRACALAQLWAMHSSGSSGAAAGGDLVFVTVSDGLGLGVVIHGELLRGRHNVAGEFGHVPLAMNGPRCACGATGCWEAYVSNRATLARYFGRSAESSEPVSPSEKDFTIEDLIARARNGDVAARAAIQATGRYLGAGLVSVVNVFDPARVYVGGEITEAWDLIAADVRAGLAERALTPAAAAMEICPVAASEYPRLQGAAALFNASAFAAPVLA